MFNPHNWHWLADDGRIFSSARGDLVSKNDSSFKEWKDAGGVPTRWPTDDEGEQTEASLHAVIQPYGLFVGLAAYKDAAIRRINEAAEHCRSKYITTGDGQAMTYLEKINQARSCVAVSSPEARDYPMLAGEIGITAPTLVGVAEAVINAYNQWLVIGSAIEAIRMAANAEVANSGTKDEVNSAIENIIWPE